VSVTQRPNARLANPNAMAKTAMMSSAVRDNQALSRFELDANGVTAFANYQLGDGIITISHTETPVAARGQGIASRLVAGALELARARGLKVIPRCPFVRAYMANHPEVSDLLA
jgi:predicted GNAT family acetyltransferase